MNAFSRFNLALLNKMSVSPYLTCGLIKPFSNVRGPRGQL